MNDELDQEGFECFRTGGTWLPSRMAAAALLAAPCVTALPACPFGVPDFPTPAEASTSSYACTPSSFNTAVVSSSTQLDASLDRYADPKSFIRDTLVSNGFVAARISETADDSLLIQFNSNRPSCVDVYPNGDVIVIVPNGEFTDTYELDVDDIDLLLTVLRDAGLHH